MPAFAGKTAIQKKQFTTKDTKYTKEIQSYVVAGLHPPPDEALGKLKLLSLLCALRVLCGGNMF
jgi:hypothetical protein